MSGNLPAAPRGDSARSRLRRMDVWAALLATAVFVFAASASAQSLHDDAGKGDIAAVTRALDSGAIPNARNEDGDSPLDWAIANDHAEVARLLRERSK